MLALSFLLYCLQAPLIHAFTHHNFLRNVANEHSNLVLNSVNKASEPKHVMQRTTRREFLEQTKKTTIISMIVLSSTSGSKVCAEVSTQEDRNSEKMCQEVSRWYKGDQHLWIVGTAHISSQSASLTSQIVRKVQPDAVFLELDLKRLPRAFPDGKIKPNIFIAYRDRGGRLVLSKTIDMKRNMNPFYLLSRALDAFTDLFDVFGSSFRNLYDMLEKEGLTPGEEFINAVSEGNKVGAVTVLGDQDVDITFSRLGKALQQTEPHKYIEADKEMTRIMKNEFGLEGGGIDLTELDVNEISELVEKLKTKSVVIKLMNVFKEKTPHLYAALVTERDAYMAIGLDSQPQFKSVVAVMGMGHVNGVSQYLRSLGWQELPSVCESPSLVTYTV